MKFVRSFFVFLIWIIRSDAGNILGLFPHPGYSHFRVFYPILHGLADNGHNLTVVSYFKAPNKHNNYHEIILTGEHGIDVFDLTGQTPSRSLIEMFNEFWSLANEGKQACNVFYSSNAVKDILIRHKNNPFDLVMMEFFNTDCLLGLVHILNTSFIGISSCALMPWHYDRVALPDFPSFIPNEFVGFSEVMTYWDRLINIMVTRGTKLLYRFVEFSDNDIIRNNLHIDVDVHEIAKKTSLILVNQHYTLNGARPLVPQVIEIGGVHIDATNKTLPKDLKQFLDNATDGVIFISWGSMVKGSTIPVDKLNSIVNALKRFRQKVIWKWEDKLVPDKSDKFFYSVWIPQKEVLCHPNVKVFWSHGGLLGVSEAVYCGKPLLVTPIYGDQFLNGKAVENRNVAEILYFENITTENIYQSLTRLQFDKFTENAKILSKIYRTRYSTPLETSLWWIEHVLNSKGNILSYSPSIEMTSISYYSIDVIAFIVVVFCIVSSTFILIMKCFLRTISRIISSSSSSSGTGRARKMKAT